MRSRLSVVAASLLAAAAACCAPARETAEPSPARTPPPVAVAGVGAAPAGLHGTCPETGCPAGQRCLEWCGVAGCRPGLVFRTCELPCTSDAQCPAGLACRTIADGPGQVCNGGGAPAPRRDAPTE